MKKPSPSPKPPPPSKKRPGPGSPKDEGFRNTPFGLQKDRMPAPKDLPPSEEKPPAPDRLPRELESAGDDEIFHRMMADVEPLPEVKEAPFPLLRPVQKPLPPEDSAALQLLDDIAQGKAPFFDLTLGDEFVEGGIDGLDPRILQRLRRGEYAWQAHIDLHGLTVEESKEVLSQFLQEQTWKGHRCLLVVHGRGNHSLRQQPVLKEYLIKWMTRGFLLPRILAFATARPQDGGPGATYLLLRKPR